MKNIFKIFTVFSILSFVSCASAPIPEDMTANQLIQEGQNKFETGKYDEALKYYAATIERFGTDPVIYVEAAYETGHIYVKQKKYEAARNVFNEIIEMYSVTMPGQLPGAYRKLAQIGLDKINKTDDEE